MAGVTTQAQENSLLPQFPPATQVLAPVAVAYLDLLREVHVPAAQIAHLVVVRKRTMAILMLLCRAAFALVITGAQI